MKSRHWYLGHLGAEKPPVRDDNLVVRAETLYNNHVFGCPSRCIMQNVKTLNTIGYNVEESSQKYMRSQNTLQI